MEAKNSIARLCSQQYQKDKSMPNELLVKASLGQQKAAVMPNNFMSNGHLYNISLSLCVATWIPSLAHVVPK